MSEEQFSVEFKRKMLYTPIPQCHAAILFENVRGKMPESPGRQSLGHSFVRACPIETWSHFVWKFTGKMPESAGRQSLTEHPFAPAWCGNLLYRKNAGICRTPIPIGHRFEAATLQGICG